jgi:hypothetical protein
VAEEGLLDRVGGQLQGAAVGGGRLGGATQAAEEVAAGGVEEVVAVEVPEAARVSIRSRPAAGPSTMATATARLRATTGESATAMSWS